MQSNKIDEILSSRGVELIVRRNKEKFMSRNGIITDYPMIYVEKDNFNKSAITLIN